jgi:ribosomal protein S12 methylthiotransferase accessory factor
MWRKVVHTVSGPGRVDSRFDSGLVITTDHPRPEESTERSPPPWFHFLSSIGACITSFVAGELDDLGIDPTAVRVIQRQDYAETDDVIPEFTFEVEVPPGLPAEHQAAVLAAAERCTVKRVIEAGPGFRIEVRGG